MRIACYCLYVLSDGPTAALITHTSNDDQFRSVTFLRCFLKVVAVPSLQACMGRRSCLRLSRGLCCGTCGADMAILCADHSFHVLVVRVATRAANCRSLRALQARMHKESREGSFWGSMEFAQECPKSPNTSPFLTFLRPQKGPKIGIFKLFGVFLETFLETPKKTLFETFLRSGPGDSCKWRLGSQIITPRDSDRVFVAGTQQFTFRCFRPIFLCEFPCVLRNLTLGPMLVSFTCFPAY